MNLVSSAAKELLEDGLERLVLIGESSDGPPQAAAAGTRHLSPTILPLLRHEGNWCSLMMVMVTSNTAVMLVIRYHGDHGDHARINPFPAPDSIEETAKMAQGPLNGGAMQPHGAHQRVAPSLSGCSEGMR